MERRKFLTGAAVAGAETSLAAPSVAQGKIEMAIVATWPRDFPGLGLPAQRMASTEEPLVVNLAFPYSPRPLLATVPPSCCAIN